MMHSLEVRFDEETEKAIRSVWEVAANLYGTRYVLRNGVIPHMALLVGDATLGQVFSEVDCPSFDVGLSGLGFFANGAVAFINCKAPDELRVFHSRLYEMAMDCGAKVDDLHAPENWVPHCTIAQGCRRNLMQKIPISNMEARVKSLIHVTYPPTVIVAERPVPGRQRSQPDASDADSFGSRTQS
jgi:hypothetical protein